MRLYNTLTRAVDDVELGRDVSLYVCGVTPYDTTHVGHARTYLVFDVLVRHLVHVGHRVHYVQNVTDVDDSILARAAQLGVSYEELHRRYTAIYFEDVAALGMVPASAYPTASSGIEEIKEVIERLLRSGHAYEVDGDVYFRVARARSYGDLSRLRRDDMLRIEAGQDGTTIDDPRKEDALDFPLWKAARPGEPTWDSPWGPGRPGWHIECSTLALKHIGPRVDVHGGGADLVYPHHECEIAQSEAVTGTRPFARAWMHVAMVLLGGRKMSKSDGNLVFVRDLLEKHTADALRLYLLSTHYRTELDFDEDELRACGERAALVAEAARAAGGRGDGDATDAVERVDAALADDLDTPAAVAAVEGLARAVVDDARAGRPVRARRRALARAAARLGLQLAG
ncbi:MAG TPA: cysteine--tRNA ligase [Actinomycetota bacterium]|nr:cysteine--tRNA ligase [Actinomycetota bacterium]